MPDEGWILGRVTACNKDGSYDVTIGDRPHPYGGLTASEHFDLGEDAWLHVSGRGQIVRMSKDRETK